MTTTASDPATTETEDRLAILDLIGRLGLLVDARDWDVLERLFTTRYTATAPHSSNGRVATSTS